MNRTAALKLISTQRKKNIPWSEIAIELKKRGYRSERTGRPLSVAGVMSITTRPTVASKRRDAKSTILRKRKAA